MRKLNRPQPLSDIPDYCKFIDDNNRVFLTTDEYNVFNYRRCISLKTHKEKALPLNKMVTLLEHT